MKNALPFILLVLLVAACSRPTASETASEPRLSRQEVRRGAMRASVWRFVYCVDKGADATVLRVLLREIAATQSRGKRISVVSCEDMTADSLGAGPTIIFGTRLPAGHTDVINFLPDGVAFDRKKYLLPGDVLYVPYYDNPWSNGQTVAGLYVADSVANLVAALREKGGETWGQLFRSPWAFELHRAGGDRIYGTFKDTTWSFDDAGEIHLQNLEAPITVNDDVVVYAYDGPPAALDAGLVTGAVAMTLRARGQLGMATCAEPAEIRLYPSVERLGLRTDRMGPAFFDQETQILHLCPGAFSAAALLYASGIWEMALRDCSGGSLPRTELDLTVAYAQLIADKTQRQAQDYRNSVTASQRYAAITDSPQPADEATGAASRIIQQLVARARVQGMTPGLSSLEFLAAIQSDSEDQLTNSYAEQRRLGSALPALVRRPLPSGKLAGMTFAHEGYRVHNGYGGGKVGASLDSLVTGSVSAVAVVPYTFQRAAGQPKPFFIPANAGSENDAATTHSIRQARRRGLYVLLKPQIWVGGDSWPGDIDFTEERDWADWFDYYEYWILHYALLAEREKVEGLCLGTELVEATLKHPDRWRAIIAKVRKVYSGHLTYAANWGEEFERLTFWDDLDVIGLNSYYPLSKLANPSDEQLRAGARQWLDVATTIAKKHQKPLWLTEVGFRSVTSAWVNPHAEAADRPASAATQLRCYQALLTEVRATPELTGMFVWKWPSYLGYEGGRNTSATGFTPGGKPAFDELGRFYKEW
ncbi:glycoside hydrolase family 113 [Neolewinella antarctica]|uniref:Asl1-like glycosyl hydrolase catalytic domain-containing protein n=1 Tax=Neolewinella antarctica TaxID=442734 RepID=A0ABX0X714_9BACT|nr:hypothetical protein [Neolewinella antarctica]NJC25020.1 hypothetical protein [Neolewinella antarctica]